jgi:lysozyme family protein
MTEEERFTNFTRDFVIPHEGTTYENDPDDPGGPTKYGIDHRSHPDVDIKNLTINEAIQIYHESYWIPNGCNKLKAGLGESHYDACINCGKARANRFLAAANGDADKYNNEREAFYGRLVDSRPSSKKYLKGWVNRVNDLRKWIKK